MDTFVTTTRLAHSCGNLPTHQEIVADTVKDPAYRAERERMCFAHEVAMKVIQYRVEHHLTQAQLAQLLGMCQPHVARLEAGDHEPSLATLRRLADRLGMSFHIEITPDPASELTL